MLGAIRAIVIAAVLCAAPYRAFAFDPASYPNLKGQWIGVRGTAGGGQPSFDPVKRWGTTQDAPLTPEYAAIFKANLEDQRTGGQGTNATSTCLAPGMPMVMNAHSPMEIIVLPETTYMRVDHIRDTRRRIFTDGRSWPADIEPSFNGYSIGTWVDTDGDGRYDLLEVESRGFKSPRTFEGSGLPLHRDGESIIKERLYLDEADKNLLHNEVTVIDHALTRPWTVTRHYQRDPDGVWDFVDCAENNPHVVIGNETYMLSADGFLMPTKAGQPAP